MADNDGIRLLLKEAAFFQDFDDAALELIVPHVTGRDFEAGRYILRDGESADSFHLLRHGTVAIELAVPPRGRLVLQTLADGDLLGWSWLVPPYRWSFDARAVSPVRCLSFDARQLRTLMERNHDLGYALLQRYVRVMAARVTAARLQMLDIYTPSPASAF